MLKNRTVIKKENIKSDLKKNENFHYENKKGFDTFLATIFVSISLCFSGFSFFGKNEITEKIKNDKNKDINFDKICYDQSYYVDSSSPFGVGGILFVVTSRSSTSIRRRSSSAVRNNKQINLDNQKIKKINEKMKSISSRSSSNSKNNIGWKEDKKKIKKKK
eukprot:Trichotokara_eunicae@DN10023_c0_g1_i1.p1